MNNKKKLGIVEWTMHNHKIVLLLVALLAGIGIYALPEMPKRNIPILPSVTGWWLVCIPEPHRSR